MVEQHLRGGYFGYFRYYGHFGQYGHYGHYGARLSNIWEVVLGLPQTGGRPVLLQLRQS